jgi:hypothetical protein
MGLPSRFNIHFTIKDGIIVKLKAEETKGKTEGSITEEYYLFSMKVRRMGILI